MSAKAAAMDSGSSSSGFGGWIMYMLPMLAKAGIVSEFSITNLVSTCWIPLLLMASLAVSSLLACWFYPGGPAWGSLNKRRGIPIPGPKGFPVLGSLLEMGSLAHKRLAELAKSHSATRLMALSLGSTRMIITSTPEIAREILNSASFADRPLKQSAQQLLFGRAIGFAPYGDYWRRLRRIASNCLFSPRRIAAHQHLRQHETSEMIKAIAMESSSTGIVEVRKFLYRASLNSVMRSVFGKRFDFGNSACGEAEELHLMVREGFELLGAFNWSDHLPFLRSFDPQGVVQRCGALVPRVSAFVQKIIDEHRAKKLSAISNTSTCTAATDVGDFVDVLLELQGEDKLADEDMVAVLWEMIFRGTDTTAILTEWILAELVRHPHIQHKLYSEIESVCNSSNSSINSNSNSNNSSINSNSNNKNNSSSNSSSSSEGRRVVEDGDIERMPYLQAVVNETLRVHPPGPLLSWARLAIEDVEIKGHHIPAGTSAMVNMWAITHDESIWEDPMEFKPERFMMMNKEFDVRGSDLRLAPFGAGRRVCPGRALGLASVRLWVARLVQCFEWVKISDEEEIDMSEVLKLSCEMVKPLHIRPLPRTNKLII